MADELLEHREALRSLDWRLSAVSTDIEHIMEPAEHFRIGGGPVRMRSGIETREDEGRVREELIEIAAQLHTLTSQPVPDVDEGAGWSATISGRIPELREHAMHMQALVREAFAEVEAQLPDDVPSQPLGDLDDHEGEVPGDNRRRRTNLLFAAFILTIIGGGRGGWVDGQGCARACVRPPVGLCERRSDHRNLSRARVHGGAARGRLRDAGTSTLRRDRSVSVDRRAATPLARPVSLQDRALLEPRLAALGRVQQAALIDGVHRRRGTSARSREYAPHQGSRDDAISRSPSSTTSPVAGTSKSSHCHA